LHSQAKQDGQWEAFDSPEDYIFHIRHFTCEKIYGGQGIGLVKDFPGLDLAIKLR
jgi:hypothetical protein